MPKPGKRFLLLCLTISIVVLITISTTISCNDKSLTGTTIEVWSLLNPNGKTPREMALKQIVDNFTRETGIKVIFQTLPWQDVDSKLLTAVQAGNPPDLTWTNLFWFKQHLDAGSLLPLNDYVAKSFTKTDINDFLLYNATVNKGKKYSFQTSLIAKALFIRKDLLEQAGLQPPKTWAEFIKVAQALTAPNRPGYLFGASAAQPNQVEFLFQAPIAGRGGQVLDKNGKAVFNSHAGVETYQFYADLVHKYKVTPADVVSMTYDDVTDAFKSGRAAMIVEGSHRYSTVASALGKEKILLAELPSPTGDKPSPSIITGWALAIPKGSKHPDAAWEFIKFFTSKESQEINARIGGELPIRKSTATMPFFSTPEADYMKWWMDYVGKSSELTLNPDTWTQLNEIMAEALQQVILSPGASVKKILDDAVKKYNNLAVTR